MGVQGAKPPAGARGVPALSPFPKRLGDDALARQRPPEFLDCREALSFPDRHGTTDDLANMYWNGRSEQVSGLEWIGSFAPHDAGDRVGWCDPRQQGVEGGSQSVDIRAGSGSPPVLLRSGIPRGSTANQRGGCIRDIVFGEAKIDEHRFVRSHRHQNVGWFEITMDNGRLLRVQVAHCINNGCQQAEGHRQRIASCWLLSTHLLQVLSPNVIHEQIHPLELLMFKHPVDTRQGRVPQLLEHFSFEEEALPVWRAGVNYLFEGKDLLALSIPYQVDSVPFASGEQTLNHIASARGVSDGHANRELQVGLHHNQPHPFINMDIE